MIDQPFLQLVTSGQQDEAVDVLRLIRDHNGSAFAIELADVHDPVNRGIARKVTNGRYERLEAEDGVEQDTQHDLEASDLKQSRNTLRETVQDYVDRLSSLLNSELRRVTLLTWSLWFTASAAYTCVGSSTLTRKQTDAFFF